MSYFNEEQESYMRYLATVAREQKCASGWHVPADMKCDCGPYLIPTEPAKPAEGERKRLPTIKEMSGSIHYGGRMVINEDNEPCIEELPAPLNDQGDQIQGVEDERVRQIAAKLDRLQLQQHELVELASTDVERAYENTINDLIVDSRYLLTRNAELEQQLSQLTNEVKRQDAEVEDLRDAWRRDVRAHEDQCPATFSNCVPADCNCGLTDSREAEMERIREALKD